VAYLWKLRETVLECTGMPHGPSHLLGFYLPDIGDRNQYISLSEASCLNKIFVEAMFVVLFQGCFEGIIRDHKQTEATETN